MGAQASCLLAGYWPAKRRYTNLKIQLACYCRTFTIKRHQPPGTALSHPTHPLLVLYSSSMLNTRRSFQFNCCGAFGPEDYQSSGWFNRTRLVDRETFVPASCCHLVAANRQDNQEIYVASLRLKQCQKDAFLYIVHPSVWDSGSERRTSSLKTQVRRQTSLLSYQPGFIILRKIDIFA